jgi:hypothetical protein
LDFGVWVELLFVSLQVDWIETVRDDEEGGPSRAEGQGQFLLPLPVCIECNKRWQFKEVMSFGRNGKGLRQG